VFPSRAEGWNLDLAEMLAMGKHVITTNYSAHTEFCHGTNSRLIQIDGLEDAFDGIWFKGQGQWAEMGERQVEQLVSHMREVHALKQSGHLLPNFGGVETMKHLTWEKTAAEIVASLA
jgi:hypothetical protein